MMDRRAFCRMSAGLLAAPAALAAEDASLPSWALGPFIKDDPHNPVLGPGEGSFICPVRKERVKFEEKDVFNPAAIVRDNRVCLLYRAEDKVGRHKGTSRIGLATSDDGVHFERRAEPVLFPDNGEYRRFEWDGGCEDPRVVEHEDGTYYLTYTAFNGRMARLFVASSPDLVKWTKHGPAFQKYKGGWYTWVWSKSGSIVCRRKGERLISARIKGRYWMYWGDADIYLAHSENLVDWTPMELEGVGRFRMGRRNGLDKPGLMPALKPRNTLFDSLLVEPGPPALLTDRGILLLYNGVSIGGAGFRGKTTTTYSAGQALFDPDDPARLIDRLDRPFLEPDRDYEITGQVNNVCFIEGLVFFRGRWLLYYGTADSRIAVAVCG